MFSNSMLASMEILSLGLGHSMGAFLSIVPQAMFQTHAGLILLGWSNFALQADDFVRRWAKARNLQLDENLSQYDVLAQMYQFGEDGFVHVYRPASHGLFYAPDVPPELIQKDATLATTVPAPIMRQIADLTTLQARAPHDYHTGCHRLVSSLWLSFPGMRIARKRMH